MMRADPELSPSIAEGRATAFWSLAQRIAHLGVLGLGRWEFLKQLSEELCSFASMRAVELWMTDVELEYHWRMSADPPADPRCDLKRLDVPVGGTAGDPTRLAGRIRDLFARLKDPTRLAPEDDVSFFACDRATWNRLSVAAGLDAIFHSLVDAPADSASLVLALRDDGSFVGLLVLHAASPDGIPRSDVPMYERLSETVWRAVVNRRAQFRLRERIKELTCLHGVARISQQGGPLDAALQDIVELLPPAMQFPEIAVARLRFDNRSFATRPDARGVHCLAVPVVVAGRTRGSLDVSYMSGHAEFVTGPFLPEERELLASVAHEIAAHVERAEAADRQAALSEQLRHRDRLATIGQLAAGVAHELNEPLGNILGFAQLLQKHAGLPEAATRDAEQIVSAVLHGREIVRKLLLFARQSAASNVRIDLGQLVVDSLYFLEARCRNAGIEVRLDLTPEEAPVLGDRSELTQVLVNLGVNAIQAMQHGGVLTIRTRVADDRVLLSVHDTGVGMDACTRERLFTPFFTTKDVGAGTGLGLSVVHGIVTSHGGTIRVESEPGKGSSFVIDWPGAPRSNPVRGEP
ncbi:MAG: ATP-binding protein [Phycisphaerae bacterium]|nr:ATP-binding protein [Phycisphaerae bacterium]